MKDFDALKDIWHGQLAVPKLNVDELLKQVRKTRSSFAQKLLIESGGMLAAIIIFTLIWAYKSFEMWTSHLSMLIFISCCLYYVLAQYIDYKSISNSEPLLKQPDEYIDYLKAYQRRRYHLNTRKYAVYSICIGLAFALYFIEVYFTSPFWQTFVGVGFTVGWFIACAFLMKVYVRREQEKLGEMIGSLERIKKQFEE